MKTSVLYFPHIRLSSVPAILLCIAAAFAVLPATADSVEPLLEGWVRHQNAPFNNRCPRWSDKGTLSEERCKVGCVATALETVVSYYGREITLRQKLEGWSTVNYAVESLPQGTVIHTADILPDFGDGTAESVGCGSVEYQRAVDEVATLSLACGLMAKMNYGLRESGADAQNLVEPLKEVFGWKTAIFLDSYNYTPEQWKEILKNELRQGRPVLYTGYTMNIAGHAFVIDGFDENDRFHINWGYGGAYDGQYHDILSLSAFENPADPTPLGTMQGFFCNQQAIIICPDEVDTTLADSPQPRTGYEIAVEGIEMPDVARVGKYVPVEITLRNTTDQRITSPFEIFSNASSDDEPFRQGDYGALFGVTMDPGEVRTVTVHCQFATTGVRTVHLSPDDVHIFGNKSVEFRPAYSDKLTFGDIEFFPEEDAATFRIPVKNERNETSGSRVVYSLFPGLEKKTDTDWRHYDYVYLKAGESATLEVTFKALEKSADYIFALRWPWIIYSEYPFTLAPITSVDAPVSPSSDDAPCYDLLGRGVSREKGGLLIHNGRKILRRR